MTLKMKSNPQNVIISNIIARNDNLNDKGMEVNGHLKQFCIKKIFDRPYKNFHPRSTLHVKVTCQQAKAISILD